MNEHDRRVHEGMRLAADLPEVMPNDAGEVIGPIYEDIQASLRVPFVNLIFRVLANYPDYFVPAWSEIAPVVRSTRFEEASDALRRLAALDGLPGALHTDAEVPARLRAFNDTIHYVLPKLLLVATLFDEERVGKNLASSGSGALTEIPFGVAEGATKVEMVDPARASGPVGELFERIKSAHGHPLVSSYFRALANWPEVLTAVWAQLEPIVGSQAFEARKQELISRAAAEARSLPPSELEVRVSGQDAQEITALLTAFRRKFIPEMLIDAVLVKAMLDGAASASVSPFSVR